VSLSAEWRTTGEQDAVIVVDNANNEVREALSANPDVLSTFLTDSGDLRTWHGSRAVDGERRSPTAWGKLVIARAETGELLTMDPELFWNGIYTWFRSRGVDYDTGRR
jgi:hypothetical protein